ncbi:MAG: hypothetical protein NTV51_09070 [Verrucomicrobia bacterium]|nr:hypothetical protein [Verrucomicrobiota bacterium]
MNLPSAILRLVLVVAALSSAARLRGQEFSAQMGTTGSGLTLSSHYSWQLDYRQAFARHLAWSVAWINEGHELEHHRDGVAGQMWVVLPFHSDTFSLALGAGGYHYFDTELLSDGSTVNTHGWTPIYSLAATYYTRTPWFLRLTANRINRANDLQTNSVVAGLGYAFGERRVRFRRMASENLTTDHEFTVFLGQSIVNTAESEGALAAAVEFRSGLSPHLEWSASWINEGNPQIIRRNGFATQLWVVDAFLGKTMTLGFGVGPYLLFDRKRAPIPGRDNPRNLAALVSPTATVRLTDHWQARLTWNRVVSTYNRDADIFLLGLGYRWGDGW